MTFPWSQARDVLAGYDSLVPTLPDELTLTPTFFAGPDRELTLVMHYAWCGDPREDDRMTELVKNLGTPKSAEIRRMTCAEVLRAADRREQGAGICRLVRTVNLASLNRHVIDITTDAMVRRSSPLSWIGGHPFYGAGERIALTSTAFGVRARHFMLGIYSAWTSKDAAPHEAWADDVEAALRPYSMASAYPNYLGVDRPEQAAAAYGPNARRLLELKRRYDPAGTFAAISLPTSV